MRAGLKHKALRLIKQGKSPAEIGARLNCMPAYVRATMQRAGLSPSRAEYRIPQIHRRLADLAAEQADLQNELKTLERKATHRATAR